MGIYTPDFLIIKRKDGRIHKIIVVETKGEIYAKDPTFKEKKTFMETEFSKQNNTAFGYERFDYLYLEDTLPEKDRMTLTRRKICEFLRRINMDFIDYREKLGIGFCDKEQVNYFFTKAFNLLTE